MKSVLASALAFMLAASLSGCGADHGTSAAPPGAIAPTKHVRHLKSDERGVKDVGGIMPGFNTNMQMADAPLAGMPGATFDVGILGIDAIDQNGDSWQLTGSSTPTVIDLLTLQRSYVSLGSGTLPAGIYPSLQILIDPSTTQVVYGGRTIPVWFPTPEHPWWDPTQTVESVTIPLALSGTDGQNITASIDFNVFRSASYRNGVVYLTPRVPGGIGQPVIQGTVVNAAGAPVASATIVATDTNGNVANVTVTAADGTFQIHGLNAGGYTVSVANSYTTEAGDTVTATGNDAGAAPSTFQVVGPNSTVSVGTLTD
jgi:hypothetical protein